MGTFFNENQGRYNPEFTYKTGVDPEKDAWYTTCFIENHLDYYAFPDHVASPEQIRFMVYIEDNERFYPCSDHTFGMIMKQEKTPLIEAEYDKVFRKILRLIERQIEDKKARDYITALITIKYKHETREGIMIPSRLEKRLLKIYLDRTQIEDPCRSEKEERNRKTLTALQSEAFNEAIDFLADFSSLSRSDNLGALKEQMDFLKLQRLISLSTENKLWETDRLSRFGFSDYMDLFKRPVSGNGYEPLKRFLSVREDTGTKKILWLANEAGEVLFDLAIIKHLAQLGHKVIIAVKEGPLFEKVTFNDVEEDPSLNAELGDALEVKDKGLSKKNLAALLKVDQNIIVVSDGTQEIINLLMASTTFARIFKEVDAVITKGQEQCRRFFDTHFRFTQDIFNFSKGEDGTVCIRYKPKHPKAVRFSHEELEERAGAIIQQMENAKKEGMTVIFYSGIIGSIPGKIDLAKKIMSVYIELLKKQYSSTFIINPSEHFIPGMDADDLMYMWERVQRSGFIDIWHFQTYSDIMRAFRAMDMKIPPEWVGKDATFSTGCTKEMNIALEVQKEHPEMQIIGPSREKFLRRKEYGIGKMYDQRLAESPLV